MDVVGFAPVEPSRVTTPFDDLRLPLPDGRRVGDVDRITSVLVELGIPGASHENGRAANVEAYADHLAKLHDEAGKRAVAQWLEQGGKA